MTKERRKAPRVKVEFPVRWEGVLTQMSGTVTDLSETGCFVLTGGQVQQKELIRLEIDFPEADAVCFWSEVVDEAYEIGFAVRFTSASDEDMALLKTTLQKLLS
ncbi:MAG TPA: PilZ domain-containing protein [Pyrinomonadaceae bacterium]|nr:PilZ domain-containing protein [Pyrinomonadaceae bacterium]